VPSEIKAQLETLAAAERRKPSDLIRIILEDYVRANAPPPPVAVVHQDLKPRNIQIVYPLPTPKASSLSDKPKRK
jgi:hypothetical protein